jgi:fluoride exporter
VSGLVWLSVGLLGGVGALGRFLLDAAGSLRVGRQFPVGTLTVNASGAFLLGLLTGLGVAGRTMLLAGTATLGSYTTFSTWILESHRLGEDGELRSALANLTVSLLVGLAAAAVGRALGGVL